MPRDAILHHVLHADAAREGVSMSTRTTVFHSDFGSYIHIYEEDGDYRLEIKTVDLVLNVICPRALLRKMGLVK